MAQIAMKPKPNGKIPPDTQAFDILSRIGKAKNRIYRVGVELEGGWTELPPGVELVRDGSIHGLKGPTRKQKVSEPTYLRVLPGGQSQPQAYAQRIPSPDGSGYIYVVLRENEKDVPIPISTGELPSEPFEPAKVANWMRQSYPQVVNKTCGLHVHLSFEDARHYQLLMCPAFTVTMRDFLVEWGKEVKIEEKHPLWDRLAGKSEFCKFEFWADYQVCQGRKNYNHDVPGSRYSMINYCHSLHQTLECRVLPMFADVEMAVAAVQRVIDITNASLAINKEVERPLVAEVKADIRERVHEDQQQGRRRRVRESDAILVEEDERLVD